MRPGVPGAWPYSYYGFGLVEFIALFGCVFVKVGFLLVLLANDLVAVVAHGLLAWFCFNGSLVAFEGALLWSLLFWFVCAL